MYKQKTKCSICHEYFIDYIYRQRKYCSHACSAKGTNNNPNFNKLPIPPEARKRQGLKMRQYRGVKHWHWMGNNVVIKTIHSWLNRNFGPAKQFKCEICKVKQAFDWSSKTHEYKRDRNEFRSLCRKCHHNYDISMGFRRGRKDM